MSPHTAPCKNQTRTYRLGDWGGAQPRRTAQRRHVEAASGINHQNQTLTLENGCIGWLTRSQVYTMSIYQGCCCREKCEVERGSVFMTNKTQAVRFPKSVRLPDGVTSVDIERRGFSWIITPSEQGWAAWFDGERASCDFMEARDQPADQDRAAL